MTYGGSIFATWGIFTSVQFYFGQALSAPVYTLASIFTLGRQD